MNTVVDALTVNLTALLVIAAVRYNQSTTSSPAVDSTQSVTGATTADNQFCPIMGGKVSEDSGTAAWDGTTIGFCRDGCDETWQALSDAEKAGKIAAAQAKAEDGSDHEGHLQDAHDHS